MLGLPDNNNENSYVARKLKNAPSEHIKGAENIIGYAQGVSGATVGARTPMELGSLNKTADLKLHVCFGRKGGW